MDGITSQRRDELIAMSHGGHHRGVRDVLEAIADEEMERRRREREDRHWSDRSDGRRLVEAVLGRARGVERQRQRKAQG